MNAQSVIKPVSDPKPKPQLPGDPNPGALPNPMPKPSLPGDPKPQPTKPGALPNPMPIPAKR